MKQRTGLLLTAIILSAATFFTQSFTTKGGDHFRILLNNTLLLEQFVHNNKSIQTVSLEGAKESDNLVIHYSHCGEAGKDRVVALKDNNGKLIKQWKFADTKSTGMRVALKDVLPLITNKQVTVVYTAQGLNSMHLATIQSRSSIVKK